MLRPALAKLYPFPHRRSLRRPDGADERHLGRRINLGLRKMADATNTYTSWE